MERQENKYPVAEANLARLVRFTDREKLKEKRKGLEGTDFVIIKTYRGISLMDDAYRSLNLKMQKDKLNVNGILITM